MMLSPRVQKVITISARARTSAHFQFIPIIIRLKNHLPLDKALLDEACHSATLALECQELHEMLLDEEVKQIRTTWVHS